MAKKGNSIEEKVKFWNEYWPILQTATGDSEEHLDNKIFVVSSGAIALELTIIQFISDPLNINLAKYSAICNISALALNIAVHLLGQGFQHNQAKLIEQFLSNPTDRDSNIHKRIKQHDNWLMGLNIISLLCLFTGIILLTVFTLKNV